MTATVLPLATARVTGAAAHWQAGVPQDPHWHTGSATVTQSDSARPGASTATTRTHTLQCESRAKAGAPASHEGVLLWQVPLGHGCPRPGSLEHHHLPVTRARSHGNVCCAHSAAETAGAVPSLAYPRGEGVTSLQSRGRGHDGPWRSWVAVAVP